MPASVEASAEVMAGIMERCPAMAEASVEVMVGIMEACPAMAVVAVITAAAVTVVGDITVEATAEEDITGMAIMATDITVMATVTVITTTPAGAGAGAGADGGGPDITDGDTPIIHTMVMQVIPAMAIQAIQIPRLW